LKVCGGERVKADLILRPDLLAALEQVDQQCRTVLLPAQRGAEAAHITEDFEERPAEQLRADVWHRIGDGQGDL